jgi:hypothetical protein
MLSTWKTGGQGFSETKMVLVGKGDGEGLGFRQQWPSSCWLDVR